MQPEWAKYGVGELGTKQWTNPRCQPFDTISHVAHLCHAQRIMQDQVIKATLISDQSKLNTRRILVSWLSPNDWGGAGGFRYGNVRYSYNFETLIAGKNYYWVEDIAYGIPACRILITSRDRSKLLPPYDPTIGDGPWWYNTTRETHYRNGEKCLEFMFEEDLDIDHATSLDFVDHSPNRCCISPRNCPELGMSRRRAARRFMAFLLSSSCRLPRDLFTERDGRSRSFNEDYLGHFQDLTRSILDGVEEYNGNVTSQSKAAEPLVRAIYNDYADEDREECLDLAALFSSAAELRKAMNSFALERFRLTNCPARA